MSDSEKATFPDFTDFGKLVPGFDFLQNLTRQATGATSGLPKLPQLGSWVAPTLNVDELDKRISELKSVQFWLDQNATALKATIQALEVQKMTLATLQGMNLNMSEMANAFTVKMQDSMGLNRDGHIKPAAKSAATPTDKGHHQFAGLEVPETSYAKREAAPEERPPVTDTSARDASAEASVPGLIDPLQWWGALTQQFQTIANTAMKEVTARNPLEAGQSMAQDAFKTASVMADSATKSMTQSANSARDLMTGALRSSDSWPVPGAARKRSAAGSAAGKSTAKKTSQAAAKTTRKAAPAKSASSARGSNRASAAGKDGAVTRKAGGRSR